MMNYHKPFTALALLLASCALPARASVSESPLPADTIVVEEELGIGALADSLPSLSNVKPEITHFYPRQKKLEAKLMRRKVRFAWGAEVGGSIDMSENDMSSLDFSAAFGLKWRWIDFFGAGAGINTMVSNSGRVFPVYGMLRTGFSSSPQPLFLEIRAGVSANYLENDKETTSAYAFAGIGFNLARSAKFTSYILLGYQYVERVKEAEVPTRKDDLQYASIKLGVCF